MREEFGAVEGILEVVKVPGQQQEILLIDTENGAIEGSIAVITDSATADFFKKMKGQKVTVLGKKTYDRNGKVLCIEISNFTMKKTK